MLRLHVARANPQLAELASGAECLVAFHGPQAYVTPSWYATKAETHKVVPTWNFVAVHVGQAGDPGRSGMVARAAGGVDREPGKGRVLPWRVADAPADFIAAQMRAIVGVEIPIARIEGKWKASQNRTPPIGRAWRKAWRKRRRGHGWGSGAADWAETSHPRVASAGLRPFRVTVTRSVARRCARRRAPGPRPGCLSRPPAAARRRPRSVTAAARLFQLRAQQAEQHRREGIGGLRERRDQGHHAQRVLA